VTRNPQALLNIDFLSRTQVVTAISDTPEGNPEFHVIAPNKKKRQ
jgi:hypothetical protein